MVSVLVTSWCLAVAAAAVSLGISGAVVVALAPRLWRRPDRRWPVAAGTAAMFSLFAVVVPLTAGAGHPADPSDLPATTRGSTLTAHTVSEAPLFAESGRVTLTVPAHAQVRVTCRYSGRPPSPWRSAGTEYHVIAPGSGHIPDQYLAFDGPGPERLPHCHPKPAH